MRADTLANAERPRSDRPYAAAPLLPDIPAPNDYPFAGPVTAEIERWKRRALLAEARVAWLEGALYVARVAWASAWGTRQ